MRSAAILAVILLGGLLAAGTAQDRAPSDVPAGKKEHAIEGHKTNEDMPKQMRAMNEMMLHQLGKGDADFEKRFIDLMIPHHEGAILMAKQALKEAKRPELKQMAEKMIDAQEKEIEQLRKWRQQWYSGK